MISRFALGVQLSEATSPLMKFGTSTSSQLELTLTVTGAGGVTLGGTFSVTFTDCEQVAVFPAASVAVHTMMVSPTAYGDESGWPSLRAPSTVTPGLLSVAVAGLTLILVEHAPDVTACTMSSLHVITGGVVSGTALTV